MTEDDELTALVTELREAILDCERKREVFGRAHNVMTLAMNDLHEAQSYAEFVKTRLNQRMKDDAFKAIGYEVEERDPPFFTNLREAWRVLSSPKVDVAHEGADRSAITPRK